MADTTEEEAIAILAPGVVEIPTFPGVPLYDIRITLDGREFVFTLDWSDREQRWYLSIATLDGTPILNGVKLVPNWPLNSRCADTNRPLGVLQVLSPTDDAPLLNDLGVKSKLVYIPLPTIV